MLIKYLKIVRSKARKYERTDINGQEIKHSRLYFRVFLFVLFTLFLLFVSRNGFSERLMEYCVSALSILIGLFITILVFVSEKIPNKKDEEEKSSAKERASDMQLYNFYKQFSFMIGRTTILCVYCLIVVFFLIQIGVSYNPFDYSFVSKISAESICLFFKILINMTLRILFIYWMIRIFYNTLFAVSSLTNVINLNKKQNDSNN